MGLRDVKEGIVKVILHVTLIRPYDWQAQTPLF